jgi:hypothetical protein
MRVGDLGFGCRTSPARRGCQVRFYNGTAEQRTVDRTRGNRSQMLRLLSCSTFSCSTVLFFWFPKKLEAAGIEPASRDNPNGGLYMLSVVLCSRLHPATTRNLRMKHTL